MMSDFEDKGKILFLIPARGGSKGIPGKNIRTLLGKPLICHSIDQARAFADDCDICLSTDSDEIRSVAERYGLKVPFLRPAEFAMDNSGSYEVMIHALDYYKSIGKEYSTLVLLQPTSPLRTTDDIKKAIQMHNPDSDMTVTVTEATTNPYYNAFETDSDGYLHISKGEGKYTRRQDAPQVYEYNGAVYVINTDSLRKQRLGELKKRIPCIMPRERSVDLDSELDWQIAEILLRNLK